MGDIPLSELEKCEVYFNGEKINSVAQSQQTIEDHTEFYTRYFLCKKNRLFGIKT